MHDQLPLLFLFGPTASGKSALAMNIAEKFFPSNAVIINFDSMQVYEELSILSAQPSDQDKEIIQHELYAFLNPNQPCSAALWAEEAKRVIRNTLKNGKTPILVGGTGLYLHALLFGLSEIPDTPKDIYDEAITLQKTIGQEAFYHQLCELDPKVSDKIQPQDQQRSIRAWCVMKATGKSIYQWHKEQASQPMPYKPYGLCLLPQREENYELANQRFDEMMEMGALDEVKLFQQKFDLDKSAANAIGLHELCASLNGDMTQEEAIEKAKQYTRNYIKRQSTWLRNQTLPKIDHYVAFHYFGSEVDLADQQLLDLLKPFL